MKKMSDLMQEMGFKKDASRGTQEAFLKHLIYASTGSRVRTPTEKFEIQSAPGKVIELPKTPEQLSFEFFQEQTTRKKA